MRIKRAAHEYCALFPLMGEDALAALAADIHEHGLQEPITLFGGQILDGRNRLKACEIAGVSPRFVEYPGRPEELLTWVTSHNLQRRHLTSSQQALIAAQVAVVLKAEGKRGVTRGAAAALNVTQRHIQYAGKVLERGVPGLVELVRDGSVSVKEADAISNLPPKRQRALVKKGALDVQREARRLESKSRTWSGAARAAEQSPKPRRTKHGWDRLFTSFGVPLRSCDLSQIEAELRRLPMLGELLRDLAGRMSPAGTVDSQLTPKEFDQIVRSAQR